MNDTVDNGAPEPATVPLPVVMFGKDDDGKAHASRFDPPDAVLAERAAGLMGMKLLRLESPEQLEIGAKVSLGKIFSGGKALCPYVGKALWDRLAADPAAFEPERPADTEVPPAAPRKAKGGRPARAAANTATQAEDAAPGPATPPADHDAITVGHRVLAAEENFPETWYLAEVTALKGPELLQLRWASPEWSAEPLIVRHRDHLALLPPAIATTLK